MIYVHSICWIRWKRILLILHRVRFCFDEVHILFIIEANIFCPETTNLAYLFSYIFTSRIYSYRFTFKFSQKSSGCTRYCSVNKVFRVIAIWHKSFLGWPEVYLCEVVILHVIDEDLILYFVHLSMKWNYLSPIMRLLNDILGRRKHTLDLS